MRRDIVPEIPNIYPSTIITNVDCFAGDTHRVWNPVLEAGLDYRVGFLLGRPPDPKTNARLLETGILSMSQEQDPLYRRCNLLIRALEASILAQALEPANLAYAANTREMVGGESFFNDTCLNLTYLQQTVPQFTWYNLLIDNQRTELLEAIAHFYTQDDDGLHPYIGEQYRSIVTTEIEHILQSAAAVGIDLPEIMALLEQFDQFPDTNESGNTDNTTKKGEVIAAAREYYLMILRYHFPEAHPIICSMNFRPCEDAVNLALVRNTDLLDQINKLGPRNNRMLAKAE